MDGQTSSELLSMEQLKEILNELSAGYVKSTLTSPTLPPFKKLGVLIDYNEILEAKGTQTSTDKNKVDSEKSAQKYSCIQCRRHLPTAHLLDLHITEQHDLYFAASVERGDKPLYACFIEECAVKFYVTSERKDHCITMHKFPSNYRFDQEKITKANNRKQKQKNAMDVDVVNMSSHTENKLPYIKAFSFGQTAQRTFNIRKENEAGKALLDVQAMKDALNDMD